MNRFAILVLLAAGAGALGCEKKPPGQPVVVPDVPQCAKPPHTRTELYTPESVVADWGPPVRLGASINTQCPEDAIEISRDGQSLYFLFTTDLLDSLTPAQMLSRPNGTYVARRTGGPAAFDTPHFWDLGGGIDASLDGEPSFTPDGSKVYFHSARATNTGWQQVPPTDDFLDIYVADVVGGVPGPGVNLGPAVNSSAPDGEAAIHPDGVTLYFASNRGGGTNIWQSRRTGSTWSDAVQLPWPINSAADDTQPTFTAAGDTMYFVSTRDPLIGSAIYRASWDAGTQSWGVPEPVIKGIVGEPSLTADGRFLYLVHVLQDAAGIYDADVWYCERRP